MTGLNVDWAMSELDKFLSLTTMFTKTSEYGSWQATKADSETITKQWEVVEKILNRVNPDWHDKTEKPGYYDNEWLPMRIASIRARESLDRADEIRQNLGDDAPELSAAHLHPWIWDGASSLWSSSHFREAVEGAIRKLNAETQNKLGRRDVSETDLFNQAFSEQAPTPGRPRLHRMKADGGATFKSVQRGARTFAEGIFAGIRNPLAHEASQEMPEQEALEYLAALSVLARWVDESILEVAS